MSIPERPPFIANWRDIEKPYAWQYDEDDEAMCIGAPFGRRFGLERLGIHHERLLPGRRTSFPHAESAEEEFVYVIEGEPDVWIDGHLHRLRPGDAVGFPAGTGIAHSFLNNTEAEVRLLVVGETAKSENRIFYPRNPERRPLRSDWWDDHPIRTLGPHDGMTDKRRAEKAGRKTDRSRPKDGGCWRDSAPAQPRPARPEYQGRASKASPKPARSTGMPMPSSGVAKTMKVASLPVLSVSSNCCSRITSA